MRLRLALSLSLIALPLAAIAQTQPTHPYLPYAADRYHGQPALIPVHESLVVHNDQPVAPAGTATSCTPTRETAFGELLGAHAHTILHDATPSFYIHPEAAATPAATSPAFAIVQAFPGRQRRVFAQIRSGGPTCEAKQPIGFTASTTTPLPDGWVKITPNAPLAPGEYTLIPIPATSGALSTRVFDFRINPAAPIAADVVTAPPAEPTAQQPTR